MSMTESPGTTSGQGTTQVAKEQAGQVGQSATQAAGQVAQTSKEQVLEVASEAKAQARDLIGEARTQVSQQAGSQRDRLVETIRSLAEELESMASSGGKGGMASELAGQASTRAHDLAVFLEGREPGDLIQEARSFARQRPGAFLAGAAVLGAVAGRLTKSVRAASSDSGGSGDRLPVPSNTTTATNGFAETPVYSTGYDTGYQAPAGAPDPAIDLTGVHGVGTGGSAAGNQGEEANKGWSG